MASLFHSFHTRAEPLPATKSTFRGPTHPTPPANRHHTTGRLGSKRFGRKSDYPPLRRWPARVLWLRTIGGDKSKELSPERSCETETLGNRHDMKRCEATNSEVATIALFAYGDSECQVRNPKAFPLIPQPLDIKNGSAGRSRRLPRKAARIPG